MKAATRIIQELVREFPGLLTGDDDVNGGDLVNWLTVELDGYKPKRRKKASRKRPAQREDGLEELAGLLP